MRILLNCAKPTLFKGNEAQPKVDNTPKVQAPQNPAVQQPQFQQAKDTVEITNKQPELKCEGGACKK